MSANNIDFIFQDYDPCYHVFHNEEFEVQHLKCEQQLKQLLEGSQFKCNKKYSRFVQVQANIPKILVSNYPLEENKNSILVDALKARLLVVKTDVLSIDPVNGTLNPNFEKPYDEKFERIAVTAENVRELIELVNRNPLDLFNDDRPNIDVEADPDFKEVNINHLVSLF